MGSNYEVHSPPWYRKNKNKFISTYSNSKTVTSKQLQTTQYKIKSFPGEIYLPVSFLYDINISMRLYNDIDVFL
jgi:hypothetical protein